MLSSLHSFSTSSRPVINKELMAVHKDLFFYVCNNVGYVQYNYDLMYPKILFKKGEYDIIYTHE